MIETTRLEAMTAGQILDRSLKLFANNVPLTVGIVALVYVPYYVVTYALGTTSAADPSIAQSLGTALSILIWSVFFLPVATGAMTFAVSERFMNRPVNIAQSFGMGVRRFPTLILAQFVAGILIVIGYLFFVIPGVIFALSYALIAPVVMLEEVGAGRSRRRSWELASGHRWKILGVTLVIGIVGILINLGLGAIVLGTTPMGSTASDLGQVLASVISGLVQFPLWSIAIVLLYYDSRIRKEGFDLEVLSEALSREGAARPV